MELTIPGRKKITLQHLVLDFNGTLALDGSLLPGVAGRLRALSRMLAVRVVTADTFGTAVAELDEVFLSPTVLGSEEQGEAKGALIDSLGGSRTAAIGNGANDAAMLKRAAVGVVVNGPEGCARDALFSSDIVVPDIEAALGLLENPERLVATLRR